MFFIAIKASFCSRFLQNQTGPQSARNPQPANNPTAAQYSMKGGCGWNAPYKHYKAGLLLSDLGSIPDSFAAQMSGCGWHAPEMLQFWIGALDDRRNRRRGRSPSRRCGRIRLLLRLDGRNNWGRGRVGQDFDLFWRKVAGVAVGVGRRCYRRCYNPSSVADAIQPDDRAQHSQDDENPSRPGSPIL